VGDGAAEVGAVDGAAEVVPGAGVTGSTGTGVRVVDGAGTGTRRGGRLRVDVAVAGVVEGGGSLPAVDGACAGVVPALAPGWDGSLPVDPVACTGDTDTVTPGSTVPTVKDDVFPGAVTSIRCTAACDVAGAAVVPVPALVPLRPAEALPCAVAEAPGTTGPPAAAVPPDPGAGIVGPSAAGGPSGARPESWSASRMPPPADAARIPAAVQRRQWTGLRCAACAVRHQAGRL
jgi:hypothetical protein